MAASFGWGGCELRRVVRCSLEFGLEFRALRRGAGYGGADLDVRGKREGGQAGEWRF